MAHAAALMDSKTVCNNVAMSPDFSNEKPIYDIEYLTLNDIMTLNINFI